MSRTEIATIECPNCKQALPAWSQSCQFCGSPLKGVVRPMGAAIVDTWTDKPTWQEVCYIIVSILVIVNGGWNILQGFQIVNLGPERITEGIGAYYKIMGSISVVLGAGMLFQQLWAQFLVKWMSVLGLVIALWQLLMTTMMASATSKVIPASVIAIAIVMQVLYAAFYAFTIYVIKVVGDVDP